MTCSLLNGFVVCAIYLECRDHRKPATSPVTGRVSRTATVLSIYKVRSRWVRLQLFRVYDLAARCPC
jgi:hypothetical protein